MFMDNPWDATWRRDQPAQPQVLFLLCTRPGQIRLAQALVDNGPTVLPDEPHRHPFGAAQVSRPIPSLPPPLNPLLCLSLSLLIPCRGRPGLVVVGCHQSRPRWALGVPRPPTCQRVFEFQRPPSGVRHSALLPLHSHTTPEGPRVAGSTGAVPGMPPKPATLGDGGVPRPVLK